MSAYAIFVRKRTIDQGEMDTYSATVAPTFEGHPVKILAAYGRFEVLEGPKIEGAVVAEFPSMEAAKRWYDSPAYREVRKHRFKGAEYDVFLVDGET